MFRHVHDLFSLFPPTPSQRSPSSCAHDNYSFTYTTLRISPLSHEPTNKRNWLYWMTWLLSGKPECKFVEINVLMVSTICGAWDHHWLGKCLVNLGIRFKVLAVGSACLLLPRSSPYVDAVFRNIMWIICHTKCHIPESLVCHLDLLCKLAVEEFFRDCLWSKGKFTVSNILTEGDRKTILCWSQH